MPISNLGCLDGFEPSTFGTTIRHSNQLNYRHHFGFAGAKVYKFFQTAKHFGVFFCKKVIPSGFEPETHSLEGCCSIQLSYGTSLII